GNVQDPLELLATYGTDALRFTLAAQSAMGRDIRLSLDRIDGDRAFANKIWNAARFVLMNLEGYAASPPAPAGAALWLHARLKRAVREVRAALAEYRFNDVASAVYRFLWNEFCDWYVELAKIELASGDGERRAIAQHALVDVLDEALRLLHPVMPFVTEEIWHALPRRAASPDYLIQASYPAQRDLSPAEEIEEARYERLIEIVR